MEFRQWIGLSIEQIYSSSSSSWWVICQSAYRAEWATDTYDFVCTRAFAKEGPNIGHEVEYIIIGIVESLRVDLDCK